MQASTSRAYGETGFDTNKHVKDGLIFVFLFFKCRNWQGLEILYFAMFSGMIYLVSNDGH